MAINLHAYANKTHPFSIFTDIKTLKTWKFWDAILKNYHNITQMQKRIFDTDSYRVQD